MDLYVLSTPQSLEHPMEFGLHGLLFWFLQGLHWGINNFIAQDISRFVNTLNIKM
jgi:hypothetical protein